jgi:HEAT repeat protein
MIEAYLIKEWMMGVILSQAVIVSCLFILLSAQKLRVERLQRRKKGLEKAYSDAICRYIDDMPTDIVPPHSRISYEALTEAAIDIMAEREESQKERTRALLDGLGVVVYYRRMAESSSWLKRFYAVERLGLLGMSGLQDYFIGVLRRDGSFPVRVRAIWSLSLIADEKAPRIITEALAAEISVSSKFNEYIYSNIIASFRRRRLTSSFQAFLDELLNNDTIPSTLKRDVIEACGSTGFREAARHVVEYCSRFESGVEMKITCIRAAGRISDPDDAGLQDMIVSGLVDEDWRVRAVSAGSVHVGHEQAILKLRKLLYDPVYYVRKNAGRALAGLGEKGLAALREETSSGDRFVRDNAKFILGW